MDHYYYFLYLIDWPIFLSYLIERQSLHHMIYVKSHISQVLDFCCTYKLGKSFVSQLKFWDEVRLKFNTISELVPLLIRSYRCPRVWRCAHSRTSLIQCRSGPLTDVEGAVESHIDQVLDLGQTIIHLTNWILRRSQTQI